MFFRLLVNKRSQKHATRRRIFFTEPAPGMAPQPTRVS
jgi:hypothetical protein